MVGPDKIDPSKMDEVRYKKFCEIQNIQGDLWDKMDELKGCAHDDKAKCKLNLQINELTYRYVTENM